MNKSITYLAVICIAVAMISVSGCKDFKQFKESRSELKQEKKERKEALKAEKEAQKSDIVEVEKVENVEVIEEKDNAGDSLYFSYQRTPCFGRCPIFKLKVFNSGFATYDGTNFVDYIGLYKAQISQKTLDELEDALKEANFFWLDDSYDNENVTDLPSRIIEVNLNGKYKKVVGRYQFPEELKELFKKLDKLFENIEWEPHSEN